MQTDHNFVKKLMACEVLGGVDNICSDKTGTLTNNQMILTNIYFNLEEYSIESKKSWNFVSYPEKLKMNLQSEELFRLSISCNCIINAADATKKGLIDYVRKADTSRDENILTKKSENYFESVYLPNICNKYIIGDTSRAIIQPGC